MIDLDPSIVTQKKQGESSTSASTQTDASELLLSASDASNEQKFTNSSTCLKFIAFKQIQKVWENTAETRNICSGNKLKVICSLDLLLQLFAQKCGQPGCQLPTTVDRTFCGTSVFIKWKCAVGHNGTFWGSHKVNKSWQVILKLVQMTLPRLRGFPTS